MATISLYVSGQTELNDVNEFFQKNLMNAGENPVAFFDGVFYESHQERVGNIVFQDYLIYTDKAVYLWARGSSKDFLDRFALGTVSVNSRNKDSDFSTLNLKIRREDKEPVYVIFDMVEIREAELITRLHTVMESTIEDSLGVNYRQEIPDVIAARLLQAGRSICTPQPFTIAMESPAPLDQASSIGYGQDLLEQYKAAMGYSSTDDAQHYQDHVQGRQKNTSAAQHGLPNPAADALKGLENILPADPASLKRIASSIKDMVGEAPFKLRDQVMKDLQHVPGDVATVLTALNELLSNIAGNPQAERFVMTALTTAVRNDGVLGSISKMLKLTTGFGGGKKPSGKHPASNERQGRRDDTVGQERRSSFDDDEDETTIRRKKISIKEDTSNASSGMFTEGLPDDESLPRADERRRTRDISDDDEVSGLKRKKISIKADDNSASALVRDMMSMDTPPIDIPAAEKLDEDFRSSSVSAVDQEARRKKIRIVADSDASEEHQKASSGISEDNSVAIDSLDESGERPVPRKKIKIVEDAAADVASEISEERLTDALTEVSDKPGHSAEHCTTIESDEKKTAGQAGSVEKVNPAESGGSGDAAYPKASEDQSVKRSIKVQSTQ
ncbi:MAG: hypothetical protein JW989_05685 [Chlorobiaceae bacterium]|jgi:hypothetical protein|nr:hypothetical protein [Chlorobiaceae bacterium]